MKKSTTVKNTDNNLYNDPINKIFKGFMQIP